MRLPFHAISAALLLFTGSLLAIENPRPATKPTTNPLAQINDDLLTKHLLNSSGAEDEGTRAARRIDACMARASDRLAKENDAGHTTQQIQDQIIRDIDELIELSRKQGDPCPPSTQPSTKPSEGVGKPSESIGIKPENQDPNGTSKSSGAPRPNHARNPAGISRTISGAGNPEGSGDIREHATGWGGVSNRIRDAIVQSTSDDILEKYYKLTADYYRAIATKASERQ